MTELSPAVAARRIDQVLDMTHEFPRRTFLGSLSPPRNPNLLMRLARPVRAFYLSMSDIAGAQSLLAELI